MDKLPVDIVVSGIGKLGLSTNCKGFGKSALVLTHSILNVENPGYESDFMARVNLEYDCCKDLIMKLNISTVAFLKQQTEQLQTELGNLRVQVSSQVPQQTKDLSLLGLVPKWSGTDKAEV